MKKKSTSSGITQEVISITARDSRKLFRTFCSCSTILCGISVMFWMPWEADSMSSEGRPLIQSKIEFDPWEEEPWDDPWPCCPCCPCAPAPFPEVPAWLSSEPVMPCSSCWADSADSSVPSIEK